MAVGLESYQWRSFLFLCAIEYLLNKNRFVAASGNEPDLRAYREVFYEIKGRSEWHDLDGVYEYRSPLPFVDPLRLCVRAKFYDKKLGKAHIREFIGIMKDVLEAKRDETESFPPHHDQGVFLSMNGFTTEAEHLAFAHGIQTLSYASQPLMESVSQNILTLSKRIGEQVRFQEPAEIYALLALLRGRIVMDRQTRELLPPLWQEALEEAKRLHDGLKQIETSVIAVTSQGAYLHVLAHDAFPFEQFLQQDEGIAKIHLAKHGRRRYYYFTVNDSTRRFYFSRPGYLSDSLLLGMHSPLQQPLFDTGSFERQSFLQIGVSDQGIVRYLKLWIEPRLWIDG